MMCQAAVASPYLMAAARQPLWWGSRVIMSTSVASANEQQRCAVIPGGSTVRSHLYSPLHGSVITPDARTSVRRSSAKPHGYQRHVRSSRVTARRLAAILRDEYVLVAIERQADFADSAAEFRFTPRRPIVSGPQAGSWRGSRRSLGPTQPTWPLASRTNGRRSPKAIASSEAAKVTASDGESPVSSGDGISCCHWSGGANCTVGHSAYRSLSS